MNKNKNNKRLVLKIVGIGMVVIGIILEIIGGTLGFDYINLLIIGLLLFCFGVCIIPFAFWNDIVEHRKKKVLPAISELFKEVTQSVTSTICPHCGAENKSDSKFCNSCGKPVHKICPYCNAELSDNGKFCNACGKEQPEENGEENDGN